MKYTIVLESNYEIALFIFILILLQAIYIYMDTFVHELGHWLGAISLGYKARLIVRWNTSGCVEYFHENILPKTHKLIISLMGPLFTYVYLLVSAVYIGTGFLPGILICAINFWFNMLDHSPQKDKIPLDGTSIMELSKTAYILLLVIQTGVSLYIAHWAIQSIVHPV